MVVVILRIVAWGDFYAGGLCCRGRDAASTRGTDAAEPACLGGVDGYGVTDRGCLGNAGSKGEGIEGRSFDGSGIEDGEDAAGSVACGVAGTDASAGRENLCVGGAVRPGTA